jgi:hypothetical protein
MYNGQPYIYWNSFWRKITKGHNENNGDNRFNLGTEKLTQALKEELFAFETGGLADFTGPAWLDGTKSRPEIVLNQTDSANFLVLRDILSDILHGTSLPTSDKTGDGGDNYYDIEINVDSISDDYDVEQLADKIRSMIYDDAVYRNVNSINNIR